MTIHLVNTMSSMISKKEKTMTEEVTQDQIELPLDAPQQPGTETPDPPETPEVIGLFIAGQGSDTPELHIRYAKNIVIRPLTNPVTAAQLADILSSLN